MAAGSQVSMTELLDRQQKIVDDLASKFRNIVVLAASGGEKDDVTGQEAASKMLNINVETQGLIHAAEEYLSFNRQLKELWLFGNIRELGEGEEENVGGINMNAMKVAGMVEHLVQNRNGRVAEAAREALHDRNDPANIQAATDHAETAATVESLGKQGEKRKDGDGNGDVEMS